MTTIAATVAFAREYKCGYALALKYLQMQEDLKAAHYEITRLYAALHAAEDALRELRRSRAVAAPINVTIETLL